MSPDINFRDAEDVEQVQSWLMSQNEAVQMEAAFEVARLRIIEAANLLFSLRFAHAESTRNAILSCLHTPSLSSALKMYGIDPENFAVAVEFEVRKLGTTRPNDFWRTCGVGRPPKNCEVSNDRN